MDNQLKGGDTEKEEHFETPEQAAATDPTASGSPLIKDAPSFEPSVTKSSKTKDWWHKFWPPSKKGWIIIAIVVVVLGVGAYFLITSHKTAKPNTPVVAVKPPKSDTVASTLTGLQVSPAVNSLPITAVMIENSTDARPQSGLNEAGVVFEALAEGGITRFVALYQSNNTTSVGPVRSARPYFISWLLGFDAAYAHVGGSPEALSDIAQWGVKNMDQFYNGSYYQRVAFRPAPHNVYTTLAKLYQLEQAKGYTSSKFTGFVRKKASPLKVPTASTINLTLSNSDYNVSYGYDKTTNSYIRSNGGTVQTDADTSQQISVPVVVAMVVPESNGPLDTSGSYYSEYQTVGSGAAYVFQDGGVTIGNWTKTSNNAQISFTTSSGQPLALDPGETWITAITSTTAVSYK